MSVYIILHDLKLCRNCGRETGANVTLTEKEKSADN